MWIYKARTIFKHQALSCSDYNKNASRKKNYSSKRYTELILLTSKAEQNPATRIYLNKKKKES